MKAMMSLIAIKVHLDGDAPYLAAPRPPGHAEERGDAGGAERLDRLYPRGKKTIMDVLLLCVGGSFMQFGQRSRRAPAWLFVPAAMVIGPPFDNPGGFNVTACPIESQASCQAFDDTLNFTVS